MTQFLLRNVKALAYVPCTVDDVFFLRCTLQVKYSKVNLKATFSLKFDLADDQTFTFLYDVDNLVPTTTRCCSNARSLSNPEQTYITRGARPDVRFLSLHLKKPCLIICNSASSSTWPKASLRTSQCFVDLAKSTETEIAFD